MHAESPNTLAGSGVQVNELRLTYLNERGELDPSAEAAAQITPEAVEGYLAHVEPLWSPVTIAQTLFKLTRMGTLLAPDRDWAWLREIACDRDLVAYPKPRFDRIVTSERLVEGSGKPAPSHLQARHPDPEWAYGG